MLSAAVAYLKPASGQSRTHRLARNVIAFVVGTLLIAALSVIGGLILLAVTWAFGAFGSTLAGILGSIG